MMSFPAIVADCSCYTRVGTNGGTEIVVNFTTPLYTLYKGLKSLSQKNAINTEHESMLLGCIAMILKTHLTPIFT